MNSSLRIGIAGLGTVGAGVVKLLIQRRDEIAERAGRPVRCILVSARDRNKRRTFDIGDIPWARDARAIADSDADVVVELIGGEDGTALALVESALNARKHVVTANKALLACRGAHLAARVAQALERLRRRDFVNQVEGDVEQRGLARALDRQGHRLTVCESGMEALGAVEVVDPDLLILDMETPGLNGLLLVAAIKELAPDLPIVAVSTRSEADARALAQKGVACTTLPASVSRKASSRGARGFM